MGIPHTAAAFSNTVQATEQNFFLNLLFIKNVWVLCFKGVH